jgi:hypothetical protein
MGWMRTLLLGDIGNRLDIADTEQDIAHIRRKLRQKRSVDASQDQAIRQLQKENEQLELCLGALIRALEKKNIVTIDEVSNLVELLDEEEA